MKLTEEQIKKEPKGLNFNFKNLKNQFKSQKPSFKLLHI